ncbi:hypothetical protein LINPERHAP1_LOCUS32550 [Linum perenne]
MGKKRSAWKRIRFWRCQSISVTHLHSPDSSCGRGIDGPPTIQPNSPSLANGLGAGETGSEERRRMLRGNSMVTREAASIPVASVHHQVIDSPFHAKKSADASMVCGFSVEWRWVGSMVNWSCGGWVQW